MWTIDWHQGVFKTDDLDLLNAVSSSAAIAIENAGLFKDLQISKNALEIAYDTTLEGWAKALELRDQVTEGHTRRVTKLTVRLAEAMGITGERLNHIRRGSLLHDIGKMGIPDQILLKPGPLTASEYEIMKKHPVFAYEMLSKIEFLKPCLDIPYCHHERWDGTGYPRGLKSTADSPGSAHLLGCGCVGRAALKPAVPAGMAGRTDHRIPGQAGGYAVRSGDCANFCADEFD